MSKEKIRIDKTCLNCNHVVDQRYCPNCGQQNTVSTKTFHHLFIHFFEDLTHYDNAFWKTIINLFFKPAALSKAYLAGKRLSFLAPVRLYIFISFITFLLISLFPNEKPKKFETATIGKTKLTIPKIDSLHIEEKSIDGLTKVGILSQNNNDTIKKILLQTNDIQKNDTTNKKEVADFGYKSVTELDSIQKHGLDNSKVGGSEYWFLKKWLEVKKENTNEQISKKFSDSFTNNLPKVLFLYMPIFALILWFLHDKKRWNYFDNGIFTLHYFSFLLLIILILFFTDKIFPLLGKTPEIEWARFSFNSLGVFWMIYYFFPAHRRFYGEKIITSFIKSCAIVVINFIIVSILLVLFALYTYSNIH
ncbi:DUF3667 domain-containing protein [Flavobacterium sp. K5-23]|uniref:DUF3667 domain-containing protein n=1 Tax=Flavobacterium sp. K5-23 TaxID=2746225 RepID=UPI00200DEA40|nr:DUF3667 domain-containing protein [Flavobacterium sp. K5-23]UQD56767.1 DUF3667 domain-containing protein [Flavobacterium sp. K5-23]